MQTFLPYRCFLASARCLDDKRLGKQRVEALQILNALRKQRAGEEGPIGWINHPATVMWKNHPMLLDFYRGVCIREWVNRGFTNTMKHFLDLTVVSDESVRTIQKILEEQVGAPAWLGDHAFHASHRSNLLRKFPEHYAPLFGEQVTPDLPYVWPGAA